MLDWLRYRYQLARLHKENKRTLHYHATALQIARDEKRHKSEIDELPKNFTRQMQNNIDFIDLLQTNYLVSVAQKCLVSLPDVTWPESIDEWDNLGKWKQSEYTGRLQLTLDGLKELRLAVRAAGRERLELVRSWLTSLTGLIGVLIGLLAIILGRR